MTTLERPSWWACVGLALAALGYGAAGVQNLPSIAFGWTFITMGVGLLAAAIGLLRIPTPAGHLVVWLGLTVGAIGASAALVGFFDEVDLLTVAAGLGALGVAVAAYFGLQAWLENDLAKWAPRVNLGFYLASIGSFFYFPVEILDETYEYLIDDLLGGVGFLVAALALRSWASRATASRTAPNNRHDD